MSQPATITGWIGARPDEVPARLLARVTEVAAAHPAWSDLPLPEAFREAGECLLKGVLNAGPDVARASALDLLAADACVTWAFEAAAEDPASLGARADAAMRRIREVAE